MGATAAINTKIERVVEAVDDMIVTAIGPPTYPTSRDEVRKELRDALADFLQPALRVVESTK